MTTTDAARLARCTICNIQLAIKRGRLPAVKVGRDWQIEQEDFERWMGERKVGRPNKQTPRPTLPKSQLSDIAIQDVRQLIAMKTH